LIPVIRNFARAVLSGTLINLLQPLRHPVGGFVGEGEGEDVFQFLRLFGEV